MSPINIEIHNSKIMAQYSKVWNIEKSQYLCGFAPIIQNNLLFLGMFEFMGDVEHTGINISTQS